MSIRRAAGLRAARAAYLDDPVAVDQDVGREGRLAAPVPDLAAMQ
jgi:hypothetical protein